MKKIVSISLSSLTVLFLATGCTTSTQNIESQVTKAKAETQKIENHITDAKTEAHKAVDSHTNWGYEGVTGPAQWGALKPEFKMCSKGNMQTPINIVASEDIEITPLAFNYSTDSTDVINNGHTVQVNISDGSSVKIDGADYSLKQFHFHTPSENNINGASYPLEGHFVHATKDGKLAVVAVMFKEGEANPVLSKIWAKFPLKVNQKTDFKLTSAEINSILPENKDYYKFMGSLTTPPCTENVKWNVFKTPMTISKEQVKQFFDVFGHSNNRPIQKTNGRTISQ